MDDQPLEPLDIDDRSPGEKMIDSGRTSFARLGEHFDNQGFDLAALIWMVSTIAVVGVEIYSALHLFGGAGTLSLGTWDKIAALGQTGGPVVAVSCLIGIALAAVLDSAAGRIAIVLAGVVGVWVLVAGLFDVAAAAHRGNNTFGFGFSRENRAVGVIGGLALAGLGLVVVMVAWRAYDRATSRVSSPQPTPS